MNLEDIRAFRVGCTREMALRHVSEQVLDAALKDGELEEVEGLYYSVPKSKKHESTRSYIGKEERPLRWNKGCEWALPCYAE